jgi:hypothetical protein
MLSTEQINDLHRLYWSEHWPSAKSNAISAWAGIPSGDISDAPAQGPATQAYVPHPVCLRELHKTNRGLVVRSGASSVRERRKDLRGPQPELRTSQMNKV